MDKHTQQNDSGTSGRRPLLRRRLFAHGLSLTKANIFRFALVVPFAVVAVLAVVMHALLPPIILGRIGDSINADVAAESWEIGLDTVVLHGVTVRSRSVDGDAGEIVRVKQLTASVVPTKLLGGIGSVSEITLLDPTVRISFDASSVDRPRTNLAGLRLPGADGSDDRTSLPTIRVQGGAIDWGEHTGGRFSRLRLMRVEGELSPIEDSSGEPGLRLDLRQVLAATGQRADRSTGGMVLTGEVTGDAMAVRLNNFDFKTWLADAAPSSVRPLLDELNIEGNVSEVSVALRGTEYDRIEAEARLAGVAVTLPLAQQGQEKEALRLSDTSGWIRIEQRQFLADVDGNLSGVPYEIDLTADVRDLLEGRGADAIMPYNAKVTVEEFSFGNESDFLPILPEAVREVLARFADRNQLGAISPSAKLSATIRLSGQISGSDDGFGEAVPQTYRGLVTVRDGATAFNEFPYQFDNVRGEIEFDQERLRIRSLSGTAPTGAVLSASGLVSPLGSAAGFDLEVEVFDVPIDETFRAAMQPEHQAALGEIFNAFQYEQLVSRLLVVRPGQRELVTRAMAETRERYEELAALGDEAAAATLDDIRVLERRASTSPEVGFGGTLGLLLYLDKPAGGDGRWDVDIRADVADAMLVPEQFPLPIRVRDLAVRIDDEMVTVTRGSAVPVNGLSGLIEGTVDVSGPEPRPMLSFRAERLRTGELLNYAIGPAGRDPARAEAADIVRSLGIFGDTDAEGLLTASDEGEPEFRVSMGLGRVGLLTAPLPDRPPLNLGDATGVLEVTHQGLVLQSDALFTDISGDEALERPTAIQISLGLDWSDTTRELVSETAVGAQGFRASAPVEQIVHVFNEDVAAAMIGLRDEFRPRGMGDAEVRIASDGSGASRSTVELMGLHGVSVAQYGGRIDAEDLTGRIVIHGRRDGRAHLELGDLRGSLGFAGEDAGRFVADGTLELSAPDGVERRDRELRVAYQEGRFESALSRAFVSTQLGGRFAEDYLSHESRGAYTLDARFVPRLTEPSAATPAGIQQIARPTYTLRPEWGEITRRGRPVRIDVTEGAIVTVPERTRIENLRADGSGFSVVADGSLTPDGQGGSSLDVAIGLEAASLTPDLQALLVEELDANIKKLQFESQGRISLTGGRLRVESTATPDGPAASSRFDGLLAFENASMMLGSPLDGIAGSAQVSTSRGPTDEAPDMLILARADRARLAGVELRDARVRVEAEADQPGRIAVPVFSASGREGGRIWGESLLSPVEGQPTPNYEIAASFTGLSLAAVQDELTAFGEGLVTAAELESPRPETGARLQGRMQLAGTVERDETRRGRVSVRIAGGELWRVPLLSRLIEVKALQPPTGEPLDFATADLIVDGNSVVTEYLSVQSRTVEVFGYGLITLPDFGLDFVLYTRSISPWPIVSQFADAFLDEFGRVAITGTAKDPQTSILAFESGRRLLGSILSTDPADDESKRLDHIQRRAMHVREIRDRYREVKRPARPATISTRSDRREGRDRVARGQEQQ